MNRPRWLRVLAGCAVLAAGALMLLAAAVRLIFDSGGPLPLALLAVATAAPAVAWPILSGRWGRNLFVVQGFAAVVGLVGCVTLAVLALLEAGAAEPEAVVAWVSTAAGVALLVALVIATLPLRVARRALVASVGSLAILGFGGVGVAATLAATTDRCAAAHTGRAAWQRDRQAAAERWVDCSTLRGKTAEEIEALLGTPAGDEWLVSRNDGFLGFGRERRLSVVYGSDGRVRAASLTYAGD